MRYSDVKKNFEHAIDDNKLIELQFQGLEQYTYLAQPLWISYNGITLGWIDQEKMCMYSETACQRSLSNLISIKISKIPPDQVKISYEEIYPWEHVHIAPPLGT